MTNVEYQLLPAIQIVLNIDHNSGETCMSTSDLESMLHVLPIQYLAVPSTKLYQNLFMPAPSSLLLLHTSACIRNYWYTQWAEVASIIQSLCSATWIYWQKCLPGCLRLSAEDGCIPALDFCCLSVPVHMQYHTQFQLSLFNKASFSLHAMYEQYTSDT